MAESRVPMTIRDFFFDDPFFKTSWEDFDTVRERMFTEPRDQWKKFDQDFRESACMSNNIMLNSDSKSSSSGQPGLGNDLERQTSLNKWENGWMFPRRWMLPSLKNEFADMNLFSGKDSEVIRVKQDDNKMEVSLDTSQYRPDELSVSVSEGTVSVEGKHEEKAEDGSKMVSRQFVRKYTLPAGAEPQDVVSNLSSDGVLVITAAKSNPAIDVKINKE
jgi:HSP20 family molecular chaperone IbpA